MGDAGNASDLTHASQILAAFAAFPSPASASSVLSTPVLERAPKTHSASAAGQTPRNGVLEAVGAVPAVPDFISTPTVQTPPARGVPQPTLNMIVGGALAPTHEVPPPPASSSKSRSSLRLPSFDLLGIAVPHPDRFGIGGATGLPSYSIQDITPESLSSPRAEVDLPNAFESMNLERLPMASTLFSPLKDPTAGRPLQSPLLFRGPLTPPDDVPYLDWQNAVFTQQGAVSNDEGSAGSAQQGDAAQDGAGVGASGGMESRSAGQTLGGRASMWYDDALHAIGKL